MWFFVRQLRLWYFDDWVLIISVVDVPREARRYLIARSTMAMAEPRLILQQGQHYWAGSILGTIEKWLGGSGWYVFRIVWRAVKPCDHRAYEANNIARSSDRGAHRVPVHMEGSMNGFLHISRYRQFEVCLSLWSTGLRCWSWFLEKVVGQAPGITSLVRKQFRTCQIKYLPSIVPHGGILLSIRFCKMWPYLGLASHHLR